MPEELIRPSIAEPIYRPTLKTEEILFSSLGPYAEDFLQVSEIFKLWYAEYGNPEGVPVVVVHGGPGAGCNPNDMRFFDPKTYRIILVDQRGANRSGPRGELQDNTTAHLIADMEKLREHLNINQWVVFGGSWGSALSVLYGEAHPERCLGFILRGVFAGREYEWLQVWYGMKDVFPEVWQEFYTFLPLEEREDLIASYYKRLLSPDSNVHMPAALAFAKYDLTCCLFEHNPAAIEKILEDHSQVLGFTKIFTHYCVNKFFLRENQLLNDLSKVQHLPCIIVQGRYDIVCRARSAYDLHQAWPGSELIFVQDGGHASLEPGIAKSLVKATERMKSLIK